MSTIKSTKEAKMENYSKKQLPAKFRRKIKRKTRTKAKTRRMADKDNANKTVAITKNPNCQELLAYTVTNGPGRIFGLVLAFVLSYVLHHFLKPLSQPRITSDIVVGLFISNIPWIRESFDDKFISTLSFAAEFGMICYVFVLGLEMNPYVIFKPPTHDASIAYAGIAATFVMSCLITPFLHYSSKQFDIGYTLSLSITLSGSGSHILTRIITNLKIGKSEIGKHVIAAGVHSDMITMLLIAIGYVFVPPSSKITDVPSRITKTVATACALLIQIFFAAKVSPLVMNWVNNENPEGKPMRGSHLILAIAFVVIVCSLSPLHGYSPILSAFMVGIFLPCEGRLTKWAVGKINYLLTLVYYPVFFYWVGCCANFSKFEPGHLGTWGRLFVLLFVSIIGKVIGTVAGGAILGFHWRESVELGLLLAAKGHFHIFLAMLASNFGITSISTGTITIIVIFFSVVHAPTIVQQIIKRARKRAPTHRRALQWLDPSNELRVMLCVHGPHNVPSAINFMEISRGSADPGILVYVTDMIELTDQIAATLVQNGEGVDTVTVTDHKVTDMREQITSTIQAYSKENGDGITVRRMLALSAFNNMGRDINMLAEDLMISLIILPFHKNWRPDGTLDGGNPGFRYVNRKVLKSAPCSLGILVDRGFGSIDNLSKSARSCYVAIIFIGGKDDREALAFAGRIARHPGVKLAVIRFVLDNESDAAARRAGNLRTNASEQEEEMKLDDECFAQFYERHVATGHVSYMEKYLANSAETFAMLRSLEGQYALIIVGRGGRVNSVLTVGMSDWQQCPELGPVGDVLSGPAFSLSTSILIIQQHNQKGDLEGADVQFSTM